VCGFDRFGDDGSTDGGALGDGVPGLVKPIVRIASRTVRTGRSSSARAISLEVLPLPASSRTVASSNGVSGDRRFWFGIGGFLGGALAADWVEKLEVVAHLDPSSISPAPVNLRG
jgi:hypothetical protein